MTGDKLIVEKTSTGYQQVFIPAEVREFEHINCLTARNLEAKALVKRRKEAADAAYWARNTRLVETAIIAIATAGALIGLAHIGAIAGWVMQIGTAVDAGWAVWQFCKSNQEEKKHNE